MAVLYFVLLCIMQLFVLTSSFCNQFRYNQLQQELTRIQDELNEMESNCVTATDIPTTSLPKWEPRIKAKVRIDSPKELYDLMVAEEGSTDWRAEREWVDHLEGIAVPSETTGSSYVSSMSSYHFRRLGKTLMIKHKVSNNDRFKLRAFANKESGNYVELPFDRRDGGIGWCRIGFVKARRQSDKVNVAYNCVSFPSPEVEMDESDDYDYGTSAPKPTYTKEDIREIAERLLKIRAHEQIQKFSRLYRRTMDKDFA